jgi:DNA repair protein RecN (Recombination protein N)
MLKRLIINNFTLIEQLDINFNNGFSVITGETGAGKSIILGAISLLLGQRADIHAIKEGAQRCSVEAHFDISRYNMHKFFDDNDIDYDADDCIIRREITSAGKSRAFINDTPVALTQLRELGEQLIDIHSQHQNLLLRKENFQLNVVDIMADDNDILRQYEKSYHQYQTVEKQIETLKSEIRRNSEEEEFIRFQYEELKKAGLKEDEQEKLEAESVKISHSEEIKQTLYSIEDTMNGENFGIIERLKSSVNSIRSIAEIYPSVQELAERLESDYIDIQDIAHDISAQTDDLDFDPKRQEEVDNRLDTIYTLEKKHQATNIKELLDIMKKYGDKLDTIDNSNGELEELEQQLKAIEKELSANAGQLTQKRTKAAKRIEETMRENLIPLGMPKVKFQVSIEPKQAGPDGGDKVTFLFSANPGTGVKPLNDVASGGEIARVMLSLKAMISGTVKLPTIIFDEIDTGVSGAIAEKMAFIMQKMGNEGRQVISITHLPQIAALGSTHYRVYKDLGNNTTSTHMNMLTPEERINEIAHMLSGTTITEAAINNAKVLLKL